MSFWRGSGEKGSAFQDDRALMHRVRRKRWLAALVLTAERLTPPLVTTISIAALFVSLAWLGLYRALPDIARLLVVFILIFAFVASFLPYFRLRLPSHTDCDRMMENRNGLRHQPIEVQNDRLESEDPITRALWHEHQRRMAKQIATLEIGPPKPDIARYDTQGLRALPVLLLVTAFAYSGSNSAGIIADAFRQQQAIAAPPSMRIDAWITPPSYTGQPPVYLSGSGNDPASGVSVPQNSSLTVRVSGDVTNSGETHVYFVRSVDGTVIDVPAKEDAASETAALKEGAGASPAQAARPGGETPPGSRTHALSLSETGTVRVADRKWPISVVADTAPKIEFDRPPRRAVNGALEIAFKASDDHGLREARAIIQPIAEKPDATPLFPPPEFRLDLPKRDSREAKGITSRDLTDHPLAGHAVTITLEAKDGAGQTGRSKAVEMILPSRNFTIPLAAAVAEQRQVMALDTRDLPLAMMLSEALVIRADETIPDISHFLLIESARARMGLAQSEPALVDAADYLWEIALGIEDGDLSLAERRLRDAQQALAQALEQGASDAEIQKLMDELRQAMQEFMKALAQQQKPQTGGQQQSAQNTLRQQDLDNMLDQLENLARSGNRDEAQKLLSELQRMMNNLQAGKSQQGQQQQNSEARRQIDKLGDIMQQQQKLMDETFRLDQALRDRMQRGDPLPPEDDESRNGEPDDQMPPSGEGQDGKQEDGGSEPGLDQMTQEQLRDALKQLRQQQDQLGQELGKLQKGLKGLGLKPGNGFGDAQKEMDGAGKALGKGQGGPALEGQGRALQALRDGARDMMEQMAKAMRGREGQGQQQGQNRSGERDPLGRSRSTDGSDFDERVNVPDEIDVQRAREILEAIRKKLEENASPTLERQYLERLLDIQ